MMAMLDDVVEETKRDYEALNGHCASILAETLWGRDRGAGSRFVGGPFTRSTDTATVLSTQSLHAQFGREGEFSISI